MFRNKNSTKVLVCAGVMLWTNNAEWLEVNVNWSNNLGNKFSRIINLEKTVIQKPRCEMYKLEMKIVKRSR